MRLQLISSVGSEIIPFGITFYAQILVEGYPLILEGVEGETNRTSYQTSTVKYYEYQGDRLIVRTQNTRYEFEVIRSWKE